MNKLKFISLSIFFLLALGGCDLINGVVAEHYRGKGVYESDTGNLDQASIYFHKSIKLAPKQSDYYEDLAIVQFKKSQYLEALTTINKAIVFNPVESSHYKIRGSIKFYIKDYTGSIKDFEKVLNFDPRDKYRMLWLGIADETISNRNFHKLKELVSEEKLEDWPGPLISFYLGDLTEEDVFIKISGDQEKLCEAYFYIGHYYLRKEKIELANESFQKSVNTNVKSYIEYWSALKQLAEQKI